MSNLKRTLLVSILSLSLSGAASATPEQCAHLLQQADAYDPYVCGADSLPSIIWPEGMDPAKSGIVQYGPWKVGPQEDDDLIARLPNPRSEEGPFTAVVQNDSQSSIHMAQVPSLGACRNLAKAVLEGKTSWLILTGPENGLSVSGVVSHEAPDEVLCVPAEGKTTTFNAASFVGDLSK